MNYDKCDDGDVCVLWLCTTGVAKLLWSGKASQRECLDPMLGRRGEVNQEGRGGRERVFQT